MKNKGYAKLFCGGWGGANRVHYGRCASGVDVRSPVINSGRAYRRRALESKAASGIGPGLTLPIINLTHTICY